MPWSNQSGGGGGWKSGGNGGGGGPWGQGPSSGGPPPDLEEMLKRGQDKVKQVMHGGGIPGPLLFAVAAVALAVIAWQAFTFRVNTDEQGIVLRFGKLVRSEPPGLHPRLPYPIEEVYLPKVTRQNIIQIGMRSTGGRLGTSTRDERAESLMLTGDENIVDIDFVVLWRIKNAEKYLFNIQNPDTTVKEVAESAMREVVGQSKIQPILTEERQKTEEAVQKLMQKTLDEYGAGIVIEQVKLQKVDPPAEVIDAFRDVQAARADMERLQNEAYGYANKVVPEARGEAQRIVQGAEGYKQQVVNDATGQTSRFLQVYDQYKNAPEVTRKRMFLETMEKVLGNTDKIIIDDKSGQGVVPYLPLDKLQSKSKTPTTSSSSKGGN
jgi:membrane protease subunit HflK